MMKNEKSNKVKMYVVSFDNILSIISFGWSTLVSMLLMGLLIGVLSFLLISFCNLMIAQSLGFFGFSAIIVWIFIIKYLINIYINKRREDLKEMLDTFGKYE